MTRFVKALIFGWVVATFILMMTGCFTGIESTDTIKLSKKDKRMRQRTLAVDLLIDTISFQPLSCWKTGKEFFIVGEYVNGIFQQSDILPQSRVLKFMNSSRQELPNGTLQTCVWFEDSIGNKFSFEVSPLLRHEIMSNELPRLIDLDMVETADEILRGRHLWTLTSTWDSFDREPESGKKYRDVEVIRVEPGISNSLPIKVIFKTEESAIGTILVAVKSSNYPTRRLSSQFALSNPRNEYKNIPDEYWQNICRTVVTPGMSKQQCRLALGNPSDVITSHDWSSTYDIWVYASGQRLKFKDSILISD